MATVAARAAAGGQKHTVPSPTTRRRRSKARILSRMADVLQLPGFVNAHSHAFQRALRGRTEGRDFWTWRERMLELAREQSPSLVRAAYRAAFEEMLHSGYTAVGEFHYL